MKTKRGFHQSRPLLAATILLAGSALACKMGGSSENESNQAAPATNQGINEVVRYSGSEAVDTGQSTIRQAVAARKAADWSSANVATIYAGTVVSRVARYGNFSLISWSGPAGLQQQGWVETNTAFNSRVVLFDAGVPNTNPGFGVIGTPVVNNPNPTVATPPPPPPPTTAAPPPPPPPKTVTPPPPPPPAKTAAPPPTSKSFKPPKLR